MKIVVQWSGGKDSQASLILAVEKYGAKNVTAVFCDTGWENPLTYIHVIDIAKLMGVELVTVRSKKYKNFVDLAKKKKRFPSTKARFCTEELKIKPMIDWVLEQKDNLTLYQGIRADESESRSLMSAQCTFFKYYFVPYTDNNRKIEAVKKAIIKRGEKGATGKQKAKLEKLQKRLSQGKLDEKYHTYRKREVIEWRKNYADDIIRPIFDSTASDVMNIIFGAGQKPNPLYYMGRSRVGCDPCIMYRHSEVKAAIKFTPETISRLKEAEKECGRSFFPPTYIPKRFCTMKDKNGVKYPCVDDVINYLTGGEYQKELFAEQEKTEHRCMSFYNICE